MLLTELLTIEYILLFCSDLIWRALYSSVDEDVVHGCIFGLHVWLTKDQHFGEVMFLLHLGSDFFLPTSYLWCVCVCVRVRVCVCVLLLLLLLLLLINVVPVLKCIYIYMFGVYSVPTKCVSPWYGWLGVKNLSLATDLCPLCYRGKTKVVPLPGRSVPRRARQVVEVPEPSAAAAAEWMVKVTRHFYSTVQNITSKHINALKKQNSETEWLLAF